MTARASGPLLGIASPSPTTCDASSFKSKIFYYESSTWAAAPGASPPPTVNFPTDHDYRADLGEAYCAASPDFQRALSTLDAVYVDGAPCPSRENEECFQGSWAWKQSQPRPGPNGRIIGLSRAFWTGVHSSPIYSQYETDLMRSLLPGSEIGYAGAAPVDNFATALLAALAHEMGHLAYYTVVDPLTDPTSFCSGNFFGNPAKPSDAPWVTPVHHAPRDDLGRPWRRFQTLAERDKLWSTGRWKDRHKKPPHIRDIDHPSPGANPVASQIDALVSTPAPWASPFAAMSPDEDFVETYKFKVLTTAVQPLSAVTITVPGAGAEDIVSDYRNNLKPKLAAKVDCIPIVF